MNKTRKDSKLACLEKITKIDPSVNEIITCRWGKALGGIQQWMNGNGNDK